MEKIGQYHKTFINIILGCYCLGVLAANWYYKINHAIIGPVAMGQNANPIGITVYLAVIFGLLLLAAKLVFRQHKNAWLPIAILFIGLGVMRFTANIYVPDNSIANYVDSSVAVKGTVDGMPDIKYLDDGKIRVRYTLDAEQVTEIAEQSKKSGSKGNSAGRNVLNEINSDGAGSGKLNSCSGSILVSVTFDEHDYELAVIGKDGDRLTVAGTLRRIRDYQNPGRMDVEMSYRSKGILGRLSANKNSCRVEACDKLSLQNIASQIRDFYRKLMLSVMPESDAGAIFAMLFGGYDGIKPELLEAFTITGLVHILSVSGSHITLIAGTAGTLGRLLRLSRGATSAFAIAVIILYALLAGGVPPVVRSAIMGILTLVALQLGREKDAQLLLGLTALVYLLLTPLLLFDISFQLSFGATAGLLYIAPVIRDCLRKHMVRFLADSLAVTIGAQLSVLPIIIWYFNVVSISSLVANLVVAPGVELIIVIGLFAGLIGSLIPIVGKLIFISASLLLGLVYELTRIIAALPGSQLYLPTAGVLGSSVYYALLIAFLKWSDIKDVFIRQELEHADDDLYKKTGLNDRRFFWQRLPGRMPLVLGGIAVFALAIGAGYAAYRAMTPGELQVHFIDVGQGDSALIITPHGHAFMIDTGGTLKNTYDIGSRVDVPYLLHYGVRSLDYIFLTHAHADHAGGVGGIMEKIPVGALMIGHEGKETYKNAFGTKHEAVRRETMAPLAEGTEMMLDGVKLEVLFAPETKEAKAAGDATGNEFSNLIRISYGEASFLFTGDLVAYQEEILLNRGTPLSSTVLKVGHHGSNSSSSERFLKAVNPAWSVICVGYGNSFGHPKPEILERIAACTSSRILRTDKNGAIVFRTDGTHMKVDTYIKD